MLYTRKGDTGTTKTFDAKSGERISKSSCQTEALGTLDELNSFLGLVKVKSRNAGFGVTEKSFEEIVLNVQQSLFIIQAELAGAAKSIPPEKITKTTKKNYNIITGKIKIARYKLILINK